MQLDLSCIILVLIAWKPHRYNGHFIITCTDHLITISAPVNIHRIILKAAHTNFKISSSKVGIKPADTPGFAVCFHSTDIIKLFSTMNLMIKIERMSEGQWRERKRKQVESTKTERTSGIFQAKTKHLYLRHIKTYPAKLWERDEKTSAQCWNFLTYPIFISSYMNRVSPFSFIRQWLLFFLTYLGN